MVATLRDRAENAKFKMSAEIAAGDVIMDWHAFVVLGFFIGIVFMSDAKLIPLIDIVQIVQSDVEFAREPFVLFVGRIAIAWNEKKVHFYLK